MRVWILVVAGGVLPLLLGAPLGSITTDAGEGTWAHPMEPTAHLLLMLGLALAHALVVAGYVVTAQRSSGAAAAYAKVGALGMAMVAICEVWSGLVAETDLDAPIITALEIGYGLSSVVIVVGSVGAGLALRSDGSPVALPLLVIGLVLVVAVTLRFTASDAVGVAALTAWHLLYVWFGLALRRDTADPNAHRRRSTSVGHR